MKMTVPPRTSSTCCDRHSSICLMLANKTPGRDVDDVGRQLTGSTAGCHPTASSCDVSMFLSFKQITEI